jgi:bacteriocin-like protein
MKIKKQTKQFKKLSRKEMKSINGGGVVCYKDENGNWVMKIS